MEPHTSSAPSSDTRACGEPGIHDHDDRKRVRVKRKSLQMVLEQCQSALELLSRTDDLGLETIATEDEAIDDVGSNSSSGHLTLSGEDCETDELCRLLKARIESPNFFNSLGSIHASASQYGRHLTMDNYDCNSWNVITDKDSLDDQAGRDENKRSEDDYVLVGQEDVVDGIACFMAEYLLSLNQTKDVTPNQLQKALGKAFFVKKAQTKLQKAWHASKFIYNVASWSATAIGIYQNPLFLRVASSALWTSCSVISKLV